MLRAHVEAKWGQTFTPHVEGDFDTGYQMAQYNPPITILLVTGTVSAALFFWAQRICIILCILENGSVFASVHASIGPGHMAQRASKQTMESVGHLEKSTHVQIQAGSSALNYAHPTRLSTWVSRMLDMPETQTPGPMARSPVSSICTYLSAPPLSQRVHSRYYSLTWPLLERAICPSDVAMSWCKQKPSPNNHLATPHIYTPIQHATLPQCSPPL